MIDEWQYLDGIRVLLNKRGRKDIVQALSGAECTIDRRTQYSGKRYNFLYAVVTFYVGFQHFGFFTEEVKAVLREVADNVMPYHEGLDVMEIQVSPDLDSIPNNETQRQQLIYGQTYNSIFGAPAPDDAFQCDVFMIMPFHKDFEPVYRKIVIPTVQELGLSIKRGDDPFSKHEIMHEIWSMLNACTLVIADCTGRNPNVFYELGIAHTIGKPVIMLTQDLAELPFDVRNRRAIEYDTAFHRIDDLKEQLKNAIRSILPKPKNEVPF